MATLHGTTFIEGPTTEVWSPKSGRIITRTWTAVLPTDKSAHDALIAQLESDGWEYTRTQDQQGGKWTITATYSEEIAYSWEITSQNAEVPLFDSLYPAVQSLTPGNLQRLKFASRHLEKYINNKPEPVDTSQITLFTQMWDCYLAGVRVIPISRPLITRSYITSNLTEIGETVEFVGYPHSKATLINVEGVPNGLWSLMPESGVDFDRVNITSNFGYLKHNPNSEYVSANRIKISQSWEFGSWPVVLFGTLV